MPTCIKEYLSQYFIQPAPKNTLQRRGDVGIEIYVPFVSTRQTYFSSNPVATGDTRVFNDFVSVMYPRSAVGGYIFSPTAAPGIPDFFDINTVTELYFQGDTPPIAFNNVNALFGIIQGGLGTSTWQDSMIGGSTRPNLLGYTFILEEDNVGQGWDNTMFLQVTRCSNRVPMTQQTIGSLPTLAPVFYAGGQVTGAGYLVWYGEFATLLGDNSAPSLT